MRDLVLTPEDGPIDYAPASTAPSASTSTVRRCTAPTRCPVPLTPTTNCAPPSKRVPGGKVSNWLLDNIADGDTVDMTRAFGTFCLREGHRPVIGHSGGSGITPILSLAKSALATTDRDVYLLCADRETPTPRSSPPPSMISSPGTRAG